jgi:hypothetical protein
MPGKRESRNSLLPNLDVRLRGHDGKNSPIAQITINQKNVPFEPRGQLA